MKAKIGITCNYNQGENNYGLRKYYVDKVIIAGGIPIIIPPVDDSGYLHNWLHLCQAFILSGGGDIDPAYWEEEPDEMLREVNPLRDKFEMNLTKKAVEAKIPILGICRGCQLLNVVLGGTIYQHIWSELNHEQKSPRHFYQHHIVIEKDSRLRAWAQVDKPQVNSFHHQAVKKVASGLRVSALASDGTIEAVESRQGAWIMGVQWHPECMQDRFSANLFRSLVNEAKKV